MADLIDAPILVCPYATQLRPWLARVSNQVLCYSTAGLSFGPFFPDRAVRDEMEQHGWSRDLSGAARYGALAKQYSNMD